ncbi:ribosomal protein S7 [Metschnikowia bicuspidata]|uniref:Small ribosomal subunit protein uS7m n=1 Tax=Metschnikowia bicuspidata TaxID=27322 RepID=A0A4P9ZJN2_9ASCO|nr:ribosomal protein S7 [Metschnikowia bicuspidata]
MSFLQKTLGKVSVPFRRTAVPRAAFLPRFQSTTPSLTAKFYPLEKETITEKDVDEWLAAVKALKQENRRPETEQEIYLAQLADPQPFLNEKFVPTEEQLAEVQRFADMKVPMRDDPVINYFINMIMRNGKKSKARKIVDRAFYIVYLKTRQDPVKVFYEVLEKMSPILTVKTLKTGFAKNVVIPAPLTKRQRDRQAILWLLEGSDKKMSNDLSVRLAEEIISTWEGKSSGYEKRASMHKNAIAQRAYIRL